jgi:hypothetical protein
LKPKRKLWLIIAAIIGALLLWAGIDLFGPRRADIRRFDPKEVAHLDAVMWRSYYNRNSRQLFLQLAELMRRQFHFPLLKSNEVAAYAAKAAFVFKDGHNRADYEKALPELEEYFQAIRDISTKSFDVQRAAQLELEWWIVHRERGHHADGDLARALAEAASELYQVPADKLMEYGRYRADAMKIRDTRAFDGGVTEADWRQIESDLQSSWQSLWKAIQPQAASDFRR